MYVILIAAMLFISATLAGLFAPPFAKSSNEEIEKNLYQCCNTGDGEQCVPDRSEGIGTYGGDEYALLKSDIYIKTLQNTEHYDPAPKNSGGALAGKAIFVNVVPDKKKEGRGHEPECKKNPDPGFDWVYGKKVNKDDTNRDYGCYRVPDDMLIYICRDDNQPGECAKKGDLDAKKARFDVWIRLRNVPNDDIHSKYEFLTRCYKPENEELRGSRSIVFRPSPGGQDNLQLRTFSFVQPQMPAIWLSPFCKPAVYLYPEKRSEINVSVFPKGEMLLTIPDYPKLGWDVVAEPNGDIYHHTKRFDYLYYEASIPDKLIKQPDKGYVMAYEEREAFLKNLVERLGLNEKETKQFIEYWVPILPKSPYYFVGIVPVETLDTISPLVITPRPKNTIRVTLFFKALDSRISVNEPTLQQVSRDGFTAVEWGGIFKQDKDHPFSCFM